MIVPNNTGSLSILSRAFGEISNDHKSNIGCTVALVNDDIYHWKCTLLGPKGTPYEGGVFKILLDFKEDFPNSAADVRFLTPIYHLNINPKESGQKLGHCCLSTLNFWDKETSIQGILSSVFVLLLGAGPESPYGLDRSKEYLEQRELYRQKAKYFTKKYANYEQEDYSNLRAWDFTYAE